MHPATTRRWARPIFLYSAISRIVSMDSCLARSIKLHVLTTSTSAWSGCGVSSCPRATSSPIMTSLSTRFLGQPKLTNPTFNDLFSVETIFFIGYQFHELVRIARRAPLSERIRSHGPRIGLGSWNGRLSNRSGTIHSCDCPHDRSAAPQAVRALRQDQELA